MLASALRSDRPPAPPRILVVEDDDALRGALVERLSEEGYRVCDARNGREAVAVLCERPIPELVVLDLLMPEMDGNEFLRVTAAYRRWATLPVIVVTVAPKQVSAEARNIVAVVAKPFDVETLLELVALHGRPDA